MQTVKKEKLPRIVEARAFFENNENKYAFASNAGFDTGDAQWLVAQLYGEGAPLVQVTNIYQESWRLESEGGPYCDTLLVTLPEQEALRDDIWEHIAKLRPDEVDIYKGVVRLWWD